MPQTVRSQQILEPHHPPLFYAQKWGVSSRTVNRWFRNLPGVLKIRSTAGRRVELRIPLHVAEQIYQEKTA